mmetsp:Transcript_16056/g.24925  ORF Transcript_16056/g.24925 Transcript_16056/m.24925 type:complete len:80 (+) Transcript_16056:2400-2639(+)
MDLVDFLDVLLALIFKLTNEPLDLIFILLDPHLELLGAFLLLHQVSASSFNMELFLLELHIKVLDLSLVLLLDIVLLRL